MEKSTDSSNTSATNSSSSASTQAAAGTGGSPGNQTLTTASSDANQQLQQQHHHHHPQQQQTLQKLQHHHPTTTPTKNHVNNSLGCGPSASSSLMSTIDNASGRSVGNLNSNNIMSSLNNTTLGHQSSNPTSIISTTTSCNTATTNSTTSTNNVATLSTSNSASTSSSSSSSQIAPINLNISTTTGGNFSVAVDPQITVENLKKIIAKKLKVAKDRICLLHREKELQDGSLKENNLMDGSKIILIPNVETGLLAQRPENTVMQALESLNDSQVNDFLSGKTPLNLSMRLGDHMMLIQLQLSTVNPVNGVAHNGVNCSSSSTRQRSSHHHHHHHRSSRTATTATQTAANGTSAATTTTAAGVATATAVPANHSHHHHHHHHHHHTPTAAGATGATTNTSTPSAAATSVSVATTAQNVTAVRKLELDTTCQTPRTNGTTTATPLLAPHTTTTRITATNGTSATSTSSSVTVTPKNSDLSSFLSKRDYESLQNIVKSIAMAQPSRLVQQSITTSNGAVPPSAGQSSITTIVSNSATSLPIVQSTSTSTFHTPTADAAALLEQSPIKSLSNLVSSPIKTTAIKNIPNISNNSNSSSSTTIINNVAIGPHTASISTVLSSSSSVLNSAPSSICQDPIAAKLTSCLCTRLNSGSMSSNNLAPPHSTAKQCIETACISQQQQLHPMQQQQQQRTSTIMTSTPNYKVSTQPGTIIASINGPTTSSSSSSSSSRSSLSLHKTAHNAITRKHRHHHHHHHHHHHYHHTAAVQQQLNNSNGSSGGSTNKMLTNTSTPIKVIANDSGFNSGDDSSLNISAKSPTTLKNSINNSPSVTSTTATPVVVAAATAAPLKSSNAAVVTTASTASSATTSSSTATPIELDDSGIVSDSRTLAEASRNLTQTLRKLSKEVFTNKIDFSASEETPRHKSGSGAVIESMKNHGKGIYSGTFSGTLNPALQDRYGRPKRDISTVIHILNDLLSATPQYHRGARISFEAPSTSAAAAASVAAASGSTGSVHHSSRSKHLSSKHHQSSHPCVKCIKTHNTTATSVNLQTASTNASGTTTNHTSSSSSSSICAYGECNGHYVSSKSTKNYACCQQDSTASTSTSSAVITNGTAQASNATSSSNGASSSGSHQHHHHHQQHHHASSHHNHHHHHQMIDERKVCQCRYRVHTETGERERDFTCQKCVAELDNIKTKSKLDQLRLVMQQRKQKREARKLKGAPYGARVVGTTTTAAAAAGVTDNTGSTLSSANNPITTPISVATATTTPSEVSPNHLVEEVDTAA